jgi:hypothetical protein
VERFGLEYNVSDPLESFIKIFKILSSIALLVRIDSALLLSLASVQTSCRQIYRDSRRVLSGIPFEGYNSISGGLSEGSSSFGALIPGRMALSDTKPRWLYERDLIVLLVILLRVLFS